MLDLGIDELKEKIIKEEKIIEKIFGPDSKHHDIVVAVLLMCLAIKMYVQKDLKGILHHLHINKTPLKRATVLVAFLLVLFKDDKHIIYCKKDEIYNVKNLLEKNVKNFISTEIEWISINNVIIPNEYKQDIIKFLETLEEDDDVQNVYNNIINIK